MTASPERQAIHRRSAEMHLIQHAIRDHGNGCAAEQCAGTSYDPCPLALAIERLERAYGGRIAIATAFASEGAELVHRLNAPEPTSEREHLRRQLEEIGQGTMQEWMGIVDLTGETGFDYQARVRWQNDDGDCIVGESQYGDEYGRFRITVHAEDLGPVPPIGPEEDVHDPLSGELIPAGQNAALEQMGHEIASDPEHFIWIERPLIDVRNGDTIRMPGQPGTERVVESVSPPLNWHVHPKADPWHPEQHRAEWTEVAIRFADDATRYSFSNPQMPVEIQTTESELLVINSLGGFMYRLETRRD